MKKETDYKAKIGWSLALFISTLITVVAVSALNIPLCLIMIVVNLVIYHYADPVLNKNYNERKKVKYEEAMKQRELYLKSKQVSSKKL